MSEKTPYSFWIGLLHMLKSGAIWVAPIALTLLTHADEWLPNANKYAVVISALIYLFRNYKKNK